MSDLFRPSVSLRPYVTLRTGGAAERFGIVRSADEFAEAAIWAHTLDAPLTVLGWGSNVLPSDDGVPGLVLVNDARTLTFGEGGEVVAETGIGMQDLFLATVQRGLVGLQFSVGIPGTLGGALVSNAGAYRNEIATFVRAVEVVDRGVRKWVEPEWLGFSYRDSRLRQRPGDRIALLRARLELPVGDPRPAYAEAREFQRQRISKQPPSPSAGSFFKNVIDRDLASRVEGLTEGMRKNGVVPAGFLIEACGLKGARVGGAMLARRHANFMLNVAGATATDIRRLANVARGIVAERFGAILEEEVLYVGDWTRFAPVG